MLAETNKCLAFGGSNCQLNYETNALYNLVIRSTDSGNPPRSTDFTITIKLRDVNDKPGNVNLTGYTIKENAISGTEIANVSATDEDARQRITYSLSTNPGNVFAIKGDKLITTSSSIDYETRKTYKIVIVATDNGNPPKSTSSSFTIDVLAQNEPPVEFKFSATGGQLSFPDDKAKIGENAVKNTVVGTIVVYDQDANEQLTLKLDDNAGRRFALSTMKPQCITVNTLSAKTKCEAQLLVDGALDHEKDSLLDIVIRATDRKGLFKIARYQITVVDANEPPRDITVASGKLSVQENLNNFAVAEFATVDEDVGNKHTYSLVNDAGGKFAITGSQLVTSANANLDFEKTSKYTIIVRSTDKGGLSVDKTFTVTVEDVNEVPTSLSLTNSKVMLINVYSCARARI
ncbi:protocadherin gamma-A10-like [Corticium candelabrum]|uniref:protocadherin gamma-A10-like n=1 Tax=Corticium candelabrum TaxID=121492 RepID=UPI002E25E0E0|nr:protocadherin gamma-A10-like [Corticium candelabrum]